MHKLLKRQLKRLQLASSGKIVIDAEVWQALLGFISESYEQSDTNREMIERSLKIASNELMQRNCELKSHVDTLQKNQEVIRFQARHDALTELPNRLLLEDQLEHDLQTAQQNHNQIAVLFIDLDHFKKINDTCGHKKGDELLRAIAQRLKKCLRNSDVLARLGADEFVILLKDITDANVAAGVAGRINKELSKPFRFNQQDFHISASIGISIYPQHDSDTRELIRKADMAMYHAKEKGRNNFQFFSETLQSQALHYVQMESQLRCALERSEFFLVYQPKVSLVNNQVDGFEALIRWTTPDKKHISPQEFIPIAEKSGLINKLGAWVMDHACKQIQAWLHSGYKAFSIAVNISTREILDPSLPERMGSLLRQYKIPSEMLQIEITETALMEDIHSAKHTLQQIRDLGVAISLDDFGTGYSSLSYLQNLPIDYLKIDRAFIKDLRNNKQSAAIARSIISLGHNLSLKVVAEGAEDKQTVDILAQHRCDFIQGYYFYRPMPAKDAERLLHSPLDKPILR